MVFHKSSFGISFEEMPGQYLHTDSVKGSKHFALWPLEQAARSCFKTDKWPENLPTPQAWLEFEVENLQAATKELEEQGYTLLIQNQREPWNQTVTRFISPEGLLVAVTETPSMRE